MTTNFETYPQEAMAWLQKYMTVLPTLISLTESKKMESPSWRNEVLSKAHEVETANNQVLAYHNVPIPFSQVHSVLKDIASRMDRANILLKQAIHEQNASLIDGEAAEEMDAAAKLANEDLIQELKKLL